MSNRTNFYAAVWAAFTAVGAALSANAYAPMSATFNGLFFQTNSAWQQSSGLITISTTSRGTYSAKVQLGHDRYSHSGWLSTDGMGAFDVPQHYGEWLYVQFQVDAQNPDLITGVISNSVWTATLSANRAVFDGRLNICTNAGRYTLILPGDPTSTNTPGGDSYGTINLSASGRLSFSGFLADGYKVSQSATVSEDGQWPFYLPLYSGRGSMYGWLLFNSSTNGAISGTVAWIKPEVDWDWYYPGGFTLNVPVMGSRYTRPPGGTQVLNFSTGLLEFNGGELSQSITNHVLLTPDNHIENLDSGRLHFSFSLSNGSFCGRLWDFGSWDWIQFNGVVLQDYNVGAGCFPGWDQSGEVWLQGQ
jgi:hypothetical protein